MSALASILGTIQCHLFPALDEELGPLSSREQQFVKVVELAEVERWIAPYLWTYRGRKRSQRLALAKAYIAKAIWNFPTTRACIDYVNSSTSLRRLCGWDGRADIPSEATFSRAFAEFAQGELPQKVHEAMVQKYIQPRLVGHVSRDSTPIKGREKPAKKEKKAKVKKRRGRPSKGEVRDPKEPRRLELQPQRTLASNLRDLPRPCDVGCKRDSKGYKKTWIGYKLHLDCMDGDIPVSALLTSASVHDSQAAIPLSQMSAQRITNLYDLMDAAYDAPEIHAYSEQLGHVPIIDHNPRRGGEKIKMDPAQAIRYRERSTAERVNSNLKDNFGGVFVRVRGAAKVMCHLMFGLLALTATQLFRLLE